MNTMMKYYEKYHVIQNPMVDHTVNMLKLAISHDSRGLDGELNLGSGSFFGQDGMGSPHDQYIKFDWFP